MFAPRCAACDEIITPAQVRNLCNRAADPFKKNPAQRGTTHIDFFLLQGSKETVRVVSMNKDFHVDCYVCEVRFYFFLPSSHSYKTSF